MATFGTFVSGQTLTATELNSAGDFASYTPTWTQSVAITKTVNWARYMKLNKFVYGSVKMTASSAGTGNNPILVGLPVNASSNNFLMGSMMYFDTSANSVTAFSVPAYYNSASTLSFYPYTAPSADVLEVLTDGFITGRFGQNPLPPIGTAKTGITVASGDVIYVQFMYEAA